MDRPFKAIIYKGGKKSEVLWEEDYVTEEKARAGMVVKLNEIGLGEYVVQRMIATFRKRQEGPWVEIPLVKE